MKRVMSAPVGASRASQQQLGSSSGGAGTIGTAAYHPRSTNVALDPVCRYLLFSCCPCLIFYPSSTFFFSQSFCQFQQGGPRGGTAGGAASIYGKVPSSAQGLRDRSGMGGGTGGAGRGR